MVILPGITLRSIIANPANSQSVSSSIKAAPMDTSKLTGSLELSEKLKDSLDSKISSLVMEMVAQSVEPTCVPAGKYRGTADNSS